MNSQKCERLVGALTAIKQSALRVFTSTRPHDQEKTKGLPGKPLQFYRLCKSAILLISVEHQVGRLSEKKEEMRLEGVWSDYEIETRSKVSTE